MTTAIDNNIFIAFWDANDVLNSLAQSALMLKMGYGGSREEAGEAIGSSGDEGIDGVINEDRLGLDTIYLQAKRCEATVGRPEIQKFAGTHHGKRAKKGVCITTCVYSTGTAE